MALPPLVVMGDAEILDEMFQHLGFAPVFAPVPRPSLKRGETPLAFAKRVGPLMLAENSSETALSVTHLVCCGRRILPIASNLEEAHANLALLSGRQHTVLMALTVRHGARVVQRILTLRVKFKRLEASEIAAYLGHEEWRERPGSYHPNARGVGFIRSVNGDPGALTGAPLYALSALFKGVGLDV